MDFEAWAAQEVVDDLELAMAPQWARTLRFQVLDARKTEWVKSLSERLKDPAAAYGISVIDELLFPGQRELDQLQKYCEHEYPGKSEFSLYQRCRHCQHTNYSLSVEG